MKRKAKIYSSGKPKASKNLDTHASPRIWIPAGILIAVFLGQNIYEMRRQSCSNDELVHLPAGYSYLVKRDFRLNPEHPPLMKEICALPLLFMQPKVDFTDPNWLQASSISQWEFGHRFLYSNPARADQLLFWGRLPIVLLAGWLGFIIFRWAQQLYGNAAGLLALGLYALCPNVIAHSHFITTDMGVTAFLTISFYCLWRFAKEGKTRDLCFSGLSMGAALASKYSALFLLPVALLFLWAFSRRMAPASARLQKHGNQALAGGERDRRDGKSSLDPDAFSPIGFWREFFSFDRSKLKVVIIFLGLALLVVQLSYLGSLDPLLYPRGALQVNANHDPNYEYYLNGNFKAGGFAEYFLVAFLVKATAPFLILIFIRLIFLLANWERDWRQSIFLVVPAAAFFVGVSVFAECLGVRYLLPLFPMMMVFSAGALHFIKKKAALVFVWGLLGWHCVSSLASFPYSLSYFNEFAGGPSRGIYWLDDSNIDWGQELKEVKRYMDKNGVEIVKLLSFSPYDNPDYYGIRHIDLRKSEPSSSPAKIYAISAHSIVRLKQQGVDILAQMTMVGHLGHSMYILKAP